MLNLPAKPLITRVITGSLLLVWVPCFAGVHAADPTRNGQPVPRVAAMGLPGASHGHRYLGDLSASNLRDLRQAGVNTVALWMGYPRVPPGERPDWWNDPASLQTLREVAQRCATADLDLYFVTYLGMPLSTYPQIELTPSKNIRGEGNSSPSWLDPAYWEQVVLPRDEALAEVARAGGVDGILLEPEVYGSGCLMERGMIEFGDVAFSRFCVFMGLPEETRAIPAEQRAAALDPLGLLGTYVNWQEEELLSFFRQWRNTLRRRCPTLTLGCYAPGGWKGAWVKRTMAQGLYEPGRPLLMLDPGTYCGYPGTYEWSAPKDRLVFYARFVADHLRQWGVEAQVAFGICTYRFPEWTRTQSAEGITSFLRESAQIGQGWWIWNETGDPAVILQHIRDSLGSTNQSATMR